MSAAVADAEWRLDREFSTVFSVKTPSAAALRRSGYGPRPALEHRPAALSRAQRRVLTALEEQAAPTTLAALAAVTGLHPNTLRDHLDALEQHQLVRREQ